MASESLPVKWWDSQKVQTSANEVSFDQKVLQETDTVVKLK